MSNEARAAKMILEVITRLSPSALAKANSGSRSGSSPRFAVDQPRERRERNPYSGADKYALHGVADRQAERKAGEDAQSEEAASGSGTITHRTGHCRAAARKPGNMVNAPLTMLVRSRETPAR